MIILYIITSVKHLLVASAVSRHDNDICIYHFHRNSKLNYFILFNVSSLNKDN